MKTLQTRSTQALFLLAVGAASLLVGSSSAQAGHHHSKGYVETQAPVRRFTYRPAFGGVNTKTLYLTNYAGAPYPPILGPRVTVPVEEPPVYTRPYRPFFGLFGGVR